MVFIIVCHEGPRLTTSRLTKTPSALVPWVLEDERSAASVKKGHFAQHFELSVQPWFTSLERLAKNLHSFFQRRIQAAAKARRSGLVLPPVDPNGDFQEYVDHLAWAMRSLESPGEDQVDLKPHYVFMDDLDWEDPLHGNSKRYLDDPQKSQRFKRFRVDERRLGQGPVIEIIDWANPDYMVGTSVVFPF